MNHNTFRLQLLRRFANSGSPIEGTFELTGRCNLNCKMCYVHTKTNKEFFETEKNGEWWISQIDAACKHGMLFALLTGGECMLHPDFRKIYLHLQEKGVYIRINTNGLLLTEENIAFLRQNPPFEIQLTIYGFDDESYQEVTGYASFGRVEEAILRAREAGLNLRVAITPNCYLPGGTEKIIKYLKELNVPFNVNEAMFTPYDQSGPQLISGREVETEERIRYLRLLKNKEPKIIDEGNLPPVGGNMKPTGPIARCSAGRISFVITHDGNMIPCTAMYHLRVPVHNADGFEMAWEQIRKASSEYLIPIECEGCAYRKACLSCPILRGGKVGNGHCDPAVCEMTRRLVAAGVKKLEEPQESCE